LACAEYDDSLQFSGASSIPLCYLRIVLILISVLVVCQCACATNYQVRFVELKSLQHQVGKLVADHVTVFFKACLQYCEE